MRTPPLAEVVGRNRYGRSLLGGKSRLTCESLQGPEDQKGVLILDHVHSRCQALIRDASAGARQFEALKRLVALQGQCERRKICPRENRQADNRKGHLPLLQEELRRSCHPRMGIVKANGRTIMLNQTKPTLHIPIKPTERQSDGQPQTDGPTDRQTDRHANKMLPGTALSPDCNVVVELGNRKIVF